MLGPSGSGKTMRLHVLAGMLRPTRGEVTVADQDLMALSPSALDHFRGRRMGIVLQRLHLIDSLSGVEPSAAGARRGAGVRGAGWP